MSNFSGGLGISAAPLFAEETIIYRFGRLYSLTEPWHILALAAVCLLVVAYVIYTYRRDSVELKAGVAFSLMALRVAAFVGILFFFLNLEKLAERRFVKNSRALLLVDTSQSMSLQDAGDGGKQRRIDAVIDELKDGDLIKDLQAKHDVVVYRFDEGSKPVEIAAYPKLTGATEAGEAITKQKEARARTIADARSTFTVAGVLLAIGLIAGLIYLLFGSRQAAAENTSWALLVSMVLMISSVVVGAVASLRCSDVEYSVVFGYQEDDFDPAAEEEERRKQQKEVDVDWSRVLLTRGTKTRITDTLRYVINQERGGPVAGVVLLTDGQNNHGEDVRQTIQLANDSKVKVFAVGVGSDEQQRSVRVVDLEAPPRVYPGDKFNITAFIQAYGLTGRRVMAELVSRPVKGEGGEVVEDSREMRLGDNGKLESPVFSVEPKEEGKRKYTVRVKLIGNNVSKSDDKNEKDNAKSANVEIIGRRNQVLLMAGGPTREYRFLRNLLYRDRDTTVHVLLQSGEEGISQESDKLLFDFPETEEELFEYDCLIAFDPDWLQLNESQLQMLDRWVAEKAAGMVVVAGPVFTPEWTRFRRGDNRRADIIRALYPVGFHSQLGAAADVSRFGGDAAWPLDFTRDGETAEFLWLEDDALGNEQAWAEFDGVFGFYKVKDPKPGAKVYARFSDESTKMGSELPIYLAGHFYGAGRVFFQASGEMWRIRAVDDAYFQRYYTKLIRWTSQGRLLRDSSRGVLMVDRNRCLVGDQVAVQAVLQDAQHRALQMDKVSGDLVFPDGRRKRVDLRRDKEAAREGTYVSNFTPLIDGDYRFEVQPPGGSIDELLAQEIRVRVPQLEIEDPKRNDLLLGKITADTGGKYFLGMDKALADDAIVAIPPQDQTEYLPGIRDQKFEERLMGWLMAFICGVLCMEWIIRRLSKLA